MSFKKNYYFDILQSFLPLALIITGFSGLIYGAIQDNIRMSANDPQIQIAEDSKTALENGSLPENLIPTTKVDLSLSLSPFVIIYNNQGQVVATNATLNGQVPELPPVLFNNLENQGEERLTWQPEVEVREAAVVTAYQGQTSGFILVGRSLKEVEKREDDLWLEVTIGYLVILFGSLGSIIFLKYLDSKFKA